MPLVYRESLPDQEPLGTLLCLHGFPESSFMWRDLMEATAAAGWQAVAPDLPGSGDSPYSGDGSWEAHVQAVDDFHRDQELGPVVLVVHDWGGLIGLRWACEHPEVVRGLVISNTGFFPDGRWHAMAKTLRTPDEGEQAVEAFTREALGGVLRSMSRGMTERAIDEYAKTFSSPERRRGVLEMYRSGDFSKLERYSLSTLTMPALVLWGEDDAFAPVAGAHRFVAELPDAELAIVPDAGHFVYEDAPESCATHVLRFLGRL
jgi:haloalkane dehalogenase